jgi:hypothetical protein
VKKLLICAGILSEYWMQPRVKWFKLGLSPEKAMHNAQYGHKWNWLGAFVPLPHDSYGIYFTANIRIGFEML